jgi:2-phospho-L-lactate guanylyltransferase
MIAALIPAKALNLAKGRLSAVLDEDERRQLALAMLEDVLRALQAVPRLDLVATVSPDSDVLARASALGSEPIAEPPSARGINRALTHALGILSPRGIDALLVVVADVPAASPRDIESVLAALPSDRGAVICPSVAQGTGALALRPPDAIPFRFGQRSFLAHKREAAARDLPARVLRVDSLANDIDGPDNLLDLISRPAQTATHRLLAEIGLPERLQTSHR